MVTIQLDKDRNLFYGMRALRKIQEVTGKNPYGADFWNNLDAQSVSTVLWAGLLHEDSSLSIEQVEELIDTYADLQTAFSRMAEALQSAMGTETTEANENPLAESG